MKKATSVNAFQLSRSSFASSGYKVKVIYIREKPWSVNYIPRLPWTNVALAHIHVFCFSYLKSIPSWWYSVVPWDIFGVELTVVSLQPLLSLLFYTWNKIVTCTVIRMQPGLKWCAKAQLSSSVAPRANGKSAIGIHVLFNLLQI